MEVPITRFDLESQTAEARFDLLSAHPDLAEPALVNRFLVNAVPEDLCFRCSLYPANVFIIGIQDREAGGRTASRRKQQLLGSEIRFHRVVIIQVITSEIRVCRSVELHRENPAQI